LFHASFIYCSACKQTLSTESEADPFFLNHRTFLRSRRSERVDKGPKELMTGKAIRTGLKSWDIRGFSALELNAEGLATFPDFLHPVVSKPPY
jgi:hypothetical protein